RRAAGQAAGARAGAGLGRAAPGPGPGGLVLGCMAARRRGTGPAAAPSGRPWRYRLGLVPAGPGARGPGWAGRGRLGWARLARPGPSPPGPRPDLLAPAGSRPGWPGRWPASEYR